MNMQQKEMQTKSALGGVRILEFGRAIAGPWTSQYLAQYGAQVVKCEDRKHPDLFRVTAPYKDFIPGPDRSPSFLPFNSSKYSITLDLANPKSAPVINRLLKWSDVVIENFRQGIMEKLGLGYEQIKRVKPDVIMASSSITGRKGPWSHFTGWGQNGAAMSGIYNITGWPDGEPIQPVSLGYTDFIASIFSVIAIVAALEHRHRTGKGQHIDVSHIETSVHFIASAVLDCTVNGRNQTRVGNRHPNAAPHGVFRCKDSDDSWCAIAVSTEEEWRNFCKAIDHAEWSKDRKFATLTSRKENEDELEKLVEEWTSKLAPQEVMEKMQAAGVATGIVKNTRDIMTDPHVKERQSFVRLQHPIMGLASHAAMPPKFSKIPHQLRPAPCLGEHNYYVCSHLLGISDEEFVELDQAGVFE